MVRRRCLVCLWNGKDQKMLTWTDQKRWKDMNGNYDTSNLEFFTIIPWRRHICSFWAVALQERNMLRWENWSIHRTYQSVKRCRQSWLSRASLFQTFLNTVLVKASSLKYLGSCKRWMLSLSSILDNLIYIFFNETFIYSLYSYVPVPSFRRFMASSRVDNFLLWNCISRGDNDV